jgi:hypothetical protein
MRKRETLCGRRRAILMMLLGAAASSCTIEQRVGPPKAIAVNGNPSTPPAPPPVKPAVDLSELTPRWRDWLARGDHCKRIPIEATKEPVPCGDGCPVLVSKQTFRNGEGIEHLQMTLVHPDNSNLSADVHQEHAKHSPEAPNCPEVPDSSSYDRNSTDWGPRGVCEEVGKRKP